MSLLDALPNMETVHVAACSHLPDTLGMPETEYPAFLGYKAMKGMDRINGRSAQGAKRYRRYTPTGA